VATGRPIRISDDHAEQYPGADKLATEVVLNLIRTTATITGRLAVVFRRYGLTGAGYNTLMILTGAGRPLAPHEMGERLLVTRATVTGLVDTLERQGLVRRRAAPGDRRRTLVEPTDKANELLAEVWAEHFPAQTAMMSALSDREKQTLIRLLGKLQASLDD
jgi:DNA-binding MarR family transcriptional regulator